MKKNKNYTVKVELNVLISDAEYDKYTAANDVYTAINKGLSDYGYTILTESYKAKKSSSKYILIDKLQSEVETLEHKLRSIRVAEKVEVADKAKAKLDAEMGDVNFNLAEYLGYISPLEVAEITIATSNNNHTGCTECKTCYTCNCYTRCNHTVTNITQ